MSDRLKTFVSFDFNRTFILSNQISISMDTANRVLDELYFVTSTVVDWIDIFTRPKYKHNSGVTSLLSGEKRLKNLCLGINE